MKNIFEISYKEFRGYMNYEKMENTFNINDSVIFVGVCVGAVG